MHISCPTCHFKRSVDINQIPASATIATCPKCEDKFRFRDPETGELIDEICSSVEGVNGSEAISLAGAPSSNEDLVPSDTHLRDEAPANVDENDESASTHEKNSSFAANSEEQNSTQKATQEFMEKSVQNTENTRYSQTEKLTSTEKEQNESVNDDFDSYQSSTYSEDPKPLREEDITKRYDDEDRNNPFRHPQENSDNQSRNVRNEKYQMVTDDVPWEHPERYGLIGSFIQTISRVMFRAPEFFSTIHSQSSALRPAIFYALLGLFQTICAQIWLGSFDMDTLVDHPMLQEQISSFSTPMTVMMSPFQSVFFLLLFSAFLYLAIRITNPEHADFNLILRIIAYANAPTILVIVPVLGFFIGPVWFVINIFIGVKYALRLTWQRTILALSPIFLLWFFWFFIAMGTLTKSVG